MHVNSLTICERLVAIDSIGRLKARYFRTLDTKDWGGFRDVFAEDATIGPIDSGLPPSDARITSTLDPDEFVSRVRRTLAHVTSVHHGHMPEITVESPVTAQGVWAMEDLLSFPEDSPVTRLHGFGHYHESYRRTESGWRIASMRLTRLRVELS
jgi:hypothetical protein